MKKETINNRKNQKIVVQIEQIENRKGLAFVMHGLGGFKEQPHIQTITEAFKENGYAVVRFDATNSAGESGGKLEEATATNYYEDLKDVIGWAKTQQWYQEPFCLAGHSLGGFCVAFFAENHPEKTKGLAPISVAVSGKFFLESPEIKNVWKEWKKIGVREWESSSRPGFIKRLKWSFVEDFLKYDLMLLANKLNMPTLLVVGENDQSTPLRDQKNFLSTLPGPKELHIIKGALHTFRDPIHLAEIKRIFNKWIEKLE